MTSCHVQNVAANKVLCFQMTEKKVGQFLESAVICTYEWFIEDLLGVDVLEVGETLPATAVQHDDLAGQDELGLCLHDIPL